MPRQEASDDRRYLVGIARQIVRDRDDAEDIVQDVMATAVRLGYRVELDSMCEGTMKMLAVGVRRRALNHIRDSHRRSALLERSVMSYEGRVIEWDSECLDRARIVLKLRDEIDALAPSAQLLVDLHWLKGVSTRQIAEMMGVSAVAVEKRVGRVLRRLRTRLKS